MMFTNLYERLVNRKRDGRRVAHRVEQIRDAMLGLLGDEGAKLHPRVARRIQFSVDEMALWYARGELMAALADLYGEEAAHRRVTRQTALFKGLVPKGMVTRSLSNHP
ncbi:MAG TPA: hypothetical protein PKA16_13790 [Ottowia sp.]|uniref:hypothetical protein n=1 Tax=Ottowia sp. TaxID=1898956 RepID=UPI002B7AD5A9|nr:hypothetical protein [Ottowia sp.]HMN22451.1 hypothetical protein [Ottowia sp.]